MENSDIGTFVSWLRVKSANYGKSDNVLVSLEPNNLFAIENEVIVTKKDFNNLRHYHNLFFVLAPEHRASLVRS